MQAFALGLTDGFADRTQTPKGHGERALCTFGTAETDGDWVESVVILGFSRCRGRCCTREWLYAYLSASPCVRPATLRSALALCRRWINCEQHRQQRCSHALRPLVQAMERSPSCPSPTRRSDMLTARRRRTCVRRPLGRDSSRLGDVLSQASPRSVSCEPLMIGGCAINES